jgi:hypothetical protein
MPAPIYIDGVEHKDLRNGMQRPRGRVFWRSFERTVAILKNNIKPEIPHEPVIDQVIRAIEFILKNETESGAPEPQWPQLRQLRAGEFVADIEIFNGPPDSLPQANGFELRRNLQPILHLILKVAHDGVETCIRYMKNPGREMQVLLPSNVNDAECFYVPI